MEQRTAVAPRGPPQSLWPAAKRGLENEKGMDLQPQEIVNFSRIENAQLVEHQPTIVALSVKASDMRHFFLLMLSIAIVGCESTPTARPAFDQPAEMPTYALLVSKHNARVQGIERFWARSVIEIRWLDERGSSRFEQGDGHLILDLPRHSALTIGKLGHTKLWAGSNDTYFWLFDELDTKKLYLGRHDGANDPTIPGVRQRSPLPLRPVDLPRLLGILPIAAGMGPMNTGKPAVQWVDSMFMIEPAGELTRYYFHPITYRVLRIDLLDVATRKVILTAHLDKPERIEAEKAAIGPFLNTRIEVITPGRDGNMIMYLSDMTDAERKVNPKAFDLEVLKANLKPDVTIPVISN